MSKPKVRLILGVAVFAYFVSVLERSSMGVAALSAASRFSVGAAVMSSLAVTQLVVYAAMQIPTGILLERFGAKKLIVTGSVLTGIGNTLVAFSPVISEAVVGRMIVGLGDSLVFVSMIRLINGWIPGAKATRYTQLFANLGQLGQIASAVPFAYLLGFAGWTPAFSAAAGLAFVAATVGLLALRNEPDLVRSAPLTVAGVWNQFKENLGDPMTRKAFWVHFTMQSSGSVFILLWGFPFLVKGEQISRPLAGSLLSSFVFIGFIVGPVLSRLCVRFPSKRHMLVTGVYALIISTWLLVLLNPGVNPLWQLILLVLAIGSGGPASMIAFDYSRTSIPRVRLGSSNGIINSGGFVATFISMYFIGLTLDVVHKFQLLGDIAIYSLPAFKVAFTFELIITSFGLIMFYRTRALSLQK